MTPEEIKNVKPGDMVEVKPDTTASVTWSRGRVRFVKREQSQHDDEVQTTVDVWVGELHRGYNFHGLMLVEQVRVPLSDLDTLRAEVQTLRAALEIASKDRDAFKHLADDRLEETKAMHKRAEKAERNVQTCVEHNTSLGLDRDAWRKRTEKAEADYKSLSESLDQGNPRMAEELAVALGHMEKDWFVHLEEVKRLRSERDDLKKYNDETGNECARLKHDRDKYAHRADECGADNDRLHNEVNYWCQEHKKLAGAILAISQELNRLTKGETL